MYNSLYFILLNCIWGARVAVQIISIKKQMPYPIIKDLKTNSVTEYITQPHAHYISIFFP